MFVSISWKKVNIVWPDDHTSEFEAEWLKKRCFSDQARTKAQEELFLSGKNLCCCAKVLKQES